MDQEILRNNQIDCWEEEQELNKVTIQSSQQSHSQTKETSVLSIQQNNKLDIDLNEIIALYKQIDNKLFDHQFQESVIIAEKSEFSNISEIENQRIILHSNQNSTIVQSFLESNQNLIVMKYFTIQNQDILIKKMDEYKIHHKVNTFYPESSLGLILPVRIKKQQTFEMTSCIQRAEINLYDYSQNNIVSEEEANIIFQQLLQQIINLHKINIAHRDIKPQNVLYVKEKGWLLSDFGESLEYFDSYDIYDIRGTVYFLKQNIRKQMKFGQCKQNLLSNDLYALVVSIIMIQQNYILDLQSEITHQNNKILNQILEITQLEELISLQQSLFSKSYDYQLLIKRHTYKKMNQNEEYLNKIYIMKSWLHLYKYFTIYESHNFLIPQILDLIQKNISTIVSIKDLKYHLLDIQINLNLDDVNIVPSKSRINKFKRQSIEDQQYFINTLFIQGYSETTICLANEFLKNNYNQEVHMILIDSYCRACMFEQVEQQLQNFIEGLLFEFLNSEIQVKFFWYLKNFKSRLKPQKIYMDFNVEEQSIQRRSFILQYETVIEQLDKQYKQYQCNIWTYRDYIVDVLFSYFQSNKQFNVCKCQMHICIIDYIVKQYPLELILTLLERISQMKYFQYDINQRICNNFEIAENCILLNKINSFNQQLKIINQQIFQSESWQQKISFKILILVIQIQRQLCSQQISQIYFDDLIDQLFTMLQKFPFITFEFYKINIIQMMQHFLKIIILYSIGSKSSKLLQIIEKCIYFSFVQYNNQIVILLQHHSQVQHILLELRNNNRCQRLVSKYRQLLNFEPIQVYAEEYENKIILGIKPSLRKIQQAQKKSFKLIQSVITSEFLFNRYLS